jgi:hypothetical protein
VKLAGAFELASILGQNWDLRRQVHKKNGINVDIFRITVVNKAIALTTWSGGVRIPVDGQLFPNLVREGLPTIQPEWADSLRKPFVRFMLAFGDD